MMRGSLFALALFAAGAARAQTIVPASPVDAYATVSIKTFGAKCVGPSHDDTAAIEGAISSGATAVFIPPSAAGCAFSALTMPTTPGFILFGVGPGSKLIQTGSGISWPVNLSIGYYSPTIANLTIDGTAGTGHSIDTSYAGGGTLRNLYFNNVPIGYDSILIDGSSTTYTHDDRVLGVQIYSTTAGNAGIGLGAHSSDDQIRDLIMNGNFDVGYGVYAADGAQSANIADSHPYNLAHSAFYGAASATTSLNFQFSNDTFDNARDDLVVLNNFSSPLLSNDFFEAVQSGKNALTLNNTNGTSILNLSADGVSGAGYIVDETGTSSQTSIVGGVSDQIGNFNATPFHFNSLDSSTVRSFLGYTPLGAQAAMSGTTVTAIGAGTTTYLGLNGAQSGPGATAFVAPFAGHVQSIKIATDTAPGAGQTFTFTLYKSGSAMTAASGSANPLVVSGASSYGGSIYIAPGTTDAVAQGDQLWIRLDTSAGAASANVRYVLNIAG